MEYVICTIRISKLEFHQCLVGGYYGREVECKVRDGMGK